MKQFLFLIITMIPLATFSQVCHCEASKQEIFVYSSLNLCGEVYDSASQDKIIGAFRVCDKDSVVADHLSDKAKTFLFKKIGNGINLVAIDIKIENGKLIYPEKFTRTNILLVRNKLVVLTSETPAKPIVRYLQSYFKKFTELY